MLDTDTSFDSEGMIRTHSRIATTHVDLHGERFTRQALESAARQISECYIPILWNHDIRHPPIGRTVSAQVVRLPDGEYALDTVGECWEEGDTPESLGGDGRSLRIRTENYERFGVRYDRSFRDGDGQALVRDLSSLAGIEPEFEGKKAAEPVSVLVIAAGAFAAGGIVHGFLGRLGSDLYDALKEKLKGFFQRNSERTCLIDFELLVEAEGHCFEVHVLLDEVNPQELEGLFSARFGKLDDIIDLISHAIPQVSRIVLEWKGGELRLRYGVRSDGTPFSGKITRSDHSTSPCAESPPGELADNDSKGRAQ
jgi:hypothetical protein